MNLDWGALGQELGRIIKHKPAAEQFRRFACLYTGAFYAGGKDNWSESDCSGTVCGPLWLMGYNIRCTADDLYTKLFIHDVTESYDDPAGIVAVFCVTRTSTQHFGRTVPAGTATHVAPVIGRYVVQNAFDPIRPMSTAYVYEYFRPTHDVKWRRLDWERLRRHHMLRDLCHQPDHVLQRVRRMCET